MGNLRKHAETELKAIGYKLDGTDDSHNKAAIDSILELIDVLAKQGHSGFSAPYCIDTFSKLAAFEPLGPLTGADDEWVEVGEGMFQNKRCSHVFKSPECFDGQAYDLDGRIFREPNGICYTSRDSTVPIVFPYTPKREYVDVPARSEA